MIKRIIAFKKKQTILTELIFMLKHLYICNLQNVDYFKKYLEILLYKGQYAFL